MTHTYLHTHTYTHTCIRTVLTVHRWTPPPSQMANVQFLFLSYVVFL